VAKRDKRDHRGQRGIPMMASAKKKDGKVVDWMEHVSEEQYRQ
jgi:hypothetical protein